MDLRIFEVFPNLTDSMILRDKLNRVKRRERGREKMDGASPVLPQGGVWPREEEEEREGRGWVTSVAVTCGDVLLALHVRDV